ncbi:MAG: ABC transporter substrate-binding protein [Desulfobacterales bacterium]|nr:ABC transporter substrate-binding protein [Desulfobacterales bacterium]
MSFKMIIISLFCLSFQLGCVQHPVEQKSVSVQLKWRHQTQFAGLYIAKTDGFYASRGLDVNLIPRSPGIPNDTIIDNLIHGQTYFALIGGDVFLSRRARGLPLVAIAVIFQRNPYVYATLATSDIQNPNDLLGKRIMLPPDARIQHEALMKNLGIDPAPIHYVPYRRDSMGLATGEFDAQVVYRTGSGFRLETALKQKLRFLWVEDYGIHLYADTLVTTEEVILKEPGVVQDFLDATLKGWQSAIETPEKGVEATLSFDPTLSREQQLTIMKIQSSLIHTGENPIGWMKADIWRNMLATLQIPEEQVNLKAGIDMRFLTRFYPELKEEVRP